MILIIDSDRKLSEFLRCFFAFVVFLLFRCFSICIFACVWFHFGFLGSLFSGLWLLFLLLRIFFPFWLRFFLNFRLRLFCLLFRFWFLRFNFRFHFFLSLRLRSFGLFHWFWTCFLLFMRTFSLMARFLVLWFIALALGFTFGTFLTFTCVFSNFSSFLCRLLHLCCNGRSCLYCSLFLNCSRSN